MDNTSIYSFLITKVPRLNTRKAVIMAWLSSKHISHMTSETRAALLQLVRMNKLRKYYEMDTISMLHGIQWADCCRHCPYNPSELLLAELKKNTFKIADMEKLRKRQYTTGLHTVAQQLVLCGMRPHV